MPRNKDSLTFRAVLGELVREKLLDEDGFSNIERHLLARDLEEVEPGFVKFLLAVGAWGAAICFLAFLGIMGWIAGGWLTSLVWGVAFVAGGILLYRITEHVFPRQLALASSSMGHGLVLAGTTEWAGRDGVFAALAAVSIILCIALYPLYSDSLHRFLSCLVASVFLNAWIVHNEVWQLIHVAILAKVVGLGVAFLYRQELAWLRPLGYAMALSLPATLFLVLLPDGIGTSPWWPANVVLAIAIIWLFQWIVGGWGNLRSEPMILAVASTVCLACFTTPGVLAALGLMVLGYARSDRALLAIGTLFFPIFIVVFYYEWQMTLLVKSSILAGSGTVLLAVRWILNLRGWTKELI